MASRPNSLSRSARKNACKLFVSGYFLLWADTQSQAKRSNCIVGRPNERWKNICRRKRLMFSECKRFFSFEIMKAAFSLVDRSLHGHAKQIERFDAFVVVNSWFLLLDLVFVDHARHIFVKGFPLLGVIFSKHDCRSDLNHAIAILPQSVEQEASFVHAIWIGPRTNMSRVKCILFQRDPNNLAKLGDMFISSCVRRSFRCVMG